MYQGKNLTKTNLHAIHLKLTQDCKPAAVAVVQSPSCGPPFATPWTAACQASLSFTVSWSSLKSCPLCQWCHRTISSSVSTFCSCPQSFPASEFFPVSWLFTSGEPKYWSFSFSISPSSVYSGLISFRMDWFDLLAVQGTLKNLL